MLVFSASAQQPSPQPDSAQQLTAPASPVPAEQPPATPNPSAVAPAEPAATPAETPAPAPAAAPQAQVTPPVGAITEAELKQMLVGKALFLRGGYLSDSLSFDEHGRLIGHSPQGSFTLNAIQIDKVHLLKHKIEMEGARYGMHFTAQLASEDPANAFDQVRITPKKKVVRITIDREIVVKPKKVKVPKPEKSKGKEKDKGKKVKPGTAAAGTQAAAAATQAAAAATTAPVAATAEATTPATPASGTTAPTTEAATTAAPIAATAAESATPQSATSPAAATPAASATPAAAPTESSAPQAQAATSQVAPKAQLAPPQVAAEEPELTPEEQLKASIAATPEAERPADPSRVTTTTSPAHATALLKDALDQIFAQGLDNRMMAAMPDYWKLYYQAVADKVDYRPKDPAILRQNTVDHKAHLLTSFEPDSNEFAQTNGVAGMAQYHVVIDPDGTAGEIAISRPIGFGLDEIAVEAIKKAKFEPAIRDGKPVPVMLDLDVPFRIFSKLTNVHSPPDQPDKPAETILPGPYSVPH
ncbi:MAG: energy transducer TonB [Terracidiphilus sp.]